MKVLTRMPVEATELPHDALLARYRSTSAAGHGDAYTDCFSDQIRQPVALAEFVYAFYTTRVFRTERLILRYLAGRPSTDLQARAVADGAAESFAAWEVEDRTDDQLLMRDFSGRTRSWFRVMPAASAEHPTTRLLFGSAVLPRRNPTTGRQEMGGAFRALLGFHRVYSRVLLSGARGRLDRP